MRFNKKFTIFYLYLWIYIIICSAKPQAIDICDYASKIQNIIIKKDIKPVYQSQRIESDYIKCATDEKKSQALFLTLVGGIIGLVVAPMIAPLVITKTLFGAAAVSHGLAILGGGSIASGGFGMFGGKIVVGFVGSIIGSQLVNSDEINKKCYDFAVKRNSISENHMYSSHYDEFMDNSNILYIGYLYENLFHGKGILYYKDKIVYDGEFVHGKPIKCY